MIRRPGVLVATVFALGALLGLGTSAVFLDVDTDEIRSSAEARAAALPGPIADLVLDAGQEQDVFGRVADDIRADQIRNLQIAAAAAALVAVGLGVVASRGAPDGLSRNATLHGAPDLSAGDGSHDDPHPAESSPVVPADPQP